MVTKGNKCQPGAVFVEYVIIIVAITIPTHHYIYRDRGIG